MRKNRKAILGLLTIWMGQNAEVERRGKNCGAKQGGTGCEMHLQRLMT